MQYEVHQTIEFVNWLQSLKDRKAVRAIAMRLTRAEAGHLGDAKSLGEHILEMRIFIAKGYRVYFTIRDGNLIVLLCGGDKSTQKRDIERAKTLCKKV